MVNPKCTGTIEDSFVICGESPVYGYCSDLCEALGYARKWKAVAKAYRNDRKECYVVANAMADVIEFLCAQIHKQLDARAALNAYIDHMFGSDYYRVLRDTREALYRLATHVDKMLFAEEFEEFRHLVLKAYVLTKPFLLIDNNHNIVGDDVEFLPEDEYEEIIE